MVSHMAWFVIEHLKTEWEFAELLHLLTKSNSCYQLFVAIQKVVLDHELLQWCIQ